MVEMPKPVERRCTPGQMAEDIAANGIHFNCTLYGDRVKDYKQAHTLMLAASQRVFNANRFWRIHPIHHLAGYEDKINLYAGMYIEFTHGQQGPPNGRVEEFRRIPLTDVWEPRT